MNDILRLSQKYKNIAFSVQFKGSFENGKPDGGLYKTQKGSFEKGKPGGGLYKTQKDPFEKGTPDGGLYNKKGGPHNNSAHIYTNENRKEVCRHSGQNRQHVIITEGIQSYDNNNDKMGSRPMNVGLPSKGPCKLGPIVGESMLWTQKYYRRLGNENQFVKLSRMMTEKLNDPVCQPSCVLLTGPTGCGKTSMVRECAQNLKCELRVFDSTEIQTKQLFESKVVPAVMFKGFQKSVTVIDNIEYFQNTDMLLKLLSTLCVNVKKRSKNSNRNKPAPCTLIILVGSSSFDMIYKKLQPYYIRIDMSLPKYTSMVEFGKYIIEHETEHIPADSCIRDIVELFNGDVSKFVNHLQVYGSSVGIGKYEHRDNLYKMVFNIRWRQSQADSVALKYYEDCILTTPKITEWISENIFDNRTSVHDISEYSDILSDCDVMSQLGTEYFVNCLYTLMGYFPNGKKPKTLKCPHRKQYKNRDVLFLGSVINRMTVKELIESMFIIDPVTFQVFTHNNVKMYDMDNDPKTLRVMNHKSRQFVNFSTISV